MNRILPPPVGESLTIIEPNQPPRRVRVVNILGKYVMLENGTRFHVADDKVGPRAWHVEGMAIYRDEP
jgi:hypothetical protein